MPDPRSSPVPSGRWVRIRRIELSQDERAKPLPADTATVPFVSWVNGFLVSDTQLGARASIRTLIGRVLDGELVDAAPAYTHTFGGPPPALQRAGLCARRSLRFEAS